MDDATWIAALAGGRTVVALAHARQRTEAVVGVLRRDGAVVAICAHRCGLTRLPDGLDARTTLERLDVGGNQLAELPGLPPGLRELYVDDNQLAELPALPALAVLDANRNRIAGAPPLAGLAFAYLAGNRLTAMPATTGVRYLNVGDNRLGRLALGDPAIRELRAEHARITELVIELPDGEPGRRGGHARSADLPAGGPDEPRGSHARSTDLPAGGRNEPGGSHGRATEPPGGRPSGRTVPGAPALRELALRGNQLTALPDAIGALTGLRTLDLRDNRLAALPDAIGALAELRTLDLRGNQLDELPDSLRGVPLLKLDLRWNPLRRPPAWLDELARRGCLIHT